MGRRVPRDVELVSGSDYVWLLTDENDKPKHAWTTKYELRYWLQHNSFSYMNGYRIRTSTWHGKEPVQLDLYAIRDGN